MVKARTEYTKKLLVRFARFNAVNSIGKIITYIILEIITLGIVAFGFYGAITEGEAFELAVVFAVVFPLIVPAMVFVVPLLAAKESKNLIGGLNKYEFTEREIIVDSTIQETIAQTKMNYDALVCVFETKDMFYLYISKRQALILSKLDIIDGSVSELKNLLESNKIEIKNYRVASLF